MVYANFSSNLPTGLQHFEFVDLTNGIHVHEVSQWGIWSWNGRVSVPRGLTAMFQHTRSFGLRNWLASTCDIFNRFMMGRSKWRGKVFQLWKGVDSSWNLIPWTVIWIWYYNGCNVALDINLGINTIISRLLTDALLHTIKAIYPLTKRDEEIFFV